MAKVKIKAGKDAVERAGDFGDFEDIRPGTYRMKIKEINFGYSKGDDGKADKQRPRLEFILQPYSEDREGKKRFKVKYGQLWSYLRTTGDGQENSRAMWAMALGAKPKANGSIELAVEPDPTKPGTDVGKHVIVRVKAGKNLEGDYRPEVANVWPVNPDDAEAGDDEEDEDIEDEDVEEDELDEEEDAEDPFGEDEDEDEEDDEEEEDYLTEAQLNDMPMKELGKLAADDFDLDPKDSIVKFKKGAKKGKVDQAKTKAKLVAAVLAAQGADGDDEADEPF